MTHGSLFSGIGGFDLAAEWMGWENLFHCEWDDFCKKILTCYWPNAKSYGNIDEADFTIWQGRIDVLSGGFPCQPYSHAGRRKGKDDDRHKWPEMLRAIREIQPGWVVGENVYGIVNWSNGMVFEEVQIDLENEGYEVTPYILPACGVNADHKRERTWFVAHSIGNGYREKTRLRQDSRKERKTEGKEGEWEWVRNDINGNDEARTSANATGIGQSESGKHIKQCSSETFGNRKASWSTNDGGWPTQPPVFTRNDGFPSKLDGITISDWIEKSNKGGGNAVVPQVVYQIFKSIEQYESIRRFSEAPSE
jgi:DNA (cytosine-5)-methyltransferase 1